LTVSNDQRIQLKVFMEHDADAAELCVTCANGELCRFRAAAQRTRMPSGYVALVTECPVYTAAQPGLNPVEAIDALLEMGLADMVYRMRAAPSPAAVMRWNAAVDALRRVRDMAKELESGA
jgi:hypothetical protein